MMNLFTISNAVMVALLQLGVVLFGIMAAGLGGKVAQEGGLAVPAATAFIIRYGLTLLGLPLFWIFMALRLRRNPQVSDSKKGLAFLSGFLLLAGLLIFIFCAAVRPTWHLVFSMRLQPGLEP